MDRNFKLLILAMFFGGCNEKTVLDKQNAAERQLFYNIVKDKTIIRGGERDTSVVIIKTYNNDLKNEYYFIRQGDKFLFKRDSLQFDETPYIDSLKRIGNERMTKLIYLLDSLKINSVSSDMRNQGIDLKVYLKDGSLRLYVKNPDNIKEDIFKNYFNKSKKISENWFSINE